MLHSSSSAEGWDSVGTDTTSTVMPIASRSPEALVQGESGVTVEGVVAPRPAARPLPRPPASPVVVLLCSSSSARCLCSPTSTALTSTGSSSPSPSDWGSGVVAVSSGVCDFRRHTLPSRSIRRPELVRRRRRSSMDERGTVDPGPANGLDCSKSHDTSVGAMLSPSLSRSEPDVSAAPRRPRPNTECDEPARRSPPNLDAPWGEVGVALDEASTMLLEPRRAQRPPADPRRPSELLLPRFSSA
mmetsp:Transcript_3655/g.12579  ORF Transcript_3655/g.12579 Transcript_3655/m.12579 type:complete len:244 (+) Transcript_3655:617-1348(+)